jgi:hypothetical protein
VPQFVPRPRHNPPNIRLTDSRDVSDIFNVQIIYKAIVSPTPPSSSPATYKHSNHIGAIAGGVIGGIASLVTAIMVILLCLQARRKPKTQLQTPATFLMPRSSPKHEREGIGRLWENYRSERFEKDGAQLAGENGGGPYKM